VILYLNNMYADSLAEKYKIAKSKDEVMDIEDGDVVFVNDKESTERNSIVSEKERRLEDAGNDPETKKNELKKEFKLLNNKFEVEWFKYGSDELCSAVDDKIKDCRELRDIIKGYFQDSDSDLEEIRKSVLALGRHVDYLNNVPAEQNRDRVEAEKSEKLVEDVRVAKEDFESIVAKLRNEKKEKSVARDISAGYEAIVKIDNLRDAATEAVRNERRESLSVLTFITRRLKKAESQESSVDKIESKETTDEEREDVELEESINSKKADFNILVSQLGKKAEWESVKVLILAGNTSIDKLSNTDETESAVKRINKKTYLRYLENAIEGLEKAIAQESDDESDDGEEEISYENLQDVDSALALAKKMFENLIVSSGIDNDHETVVKGREVLKEIDVTSDEYPQVDRNKKITYLNILHECIDSILDVPTEDGDSIEAKKALVEKIEVLDSKFKEVRDRYYKIIVTRQMTQAIPEYVVPGANQQITYYEGLSGDEVSEELHKNKEKSLGVLKGYVKTLKDAQGDESNGEMIEYKKPGNVTNDKNHVEAFSTGGESDVHNVSDVPEMILDSIDQGKKIFDIKEFSTDPEFAELNVPKEALDDFEEDKGSVHSSEENNTKTEYQKARQKLSEVKAKYEGTGMYGGIKGKKIEYDEAIKAHYSKQSKWISGVNSVKKFLGFDPNLPPELQRLQKEYKTLTKEYMKSLNLARKLRAERSYVKVDNKFVLYDGNNLPEDGVIIENKEYDEGSDKTKKEFISKFITKPSQELIDQQEGHILTEKQRARLKKLSKTLGKHKWLLRAGLVTVAGFAGAASGGLVTAFASAGTKAAQIGIGTVAGAGTGAAVHTIMQYGVDSADKKLVKEVDKFDLANIDNLNLDKVEEGILEAETVKDAKLRQQKLASVATAFAAGFGSRDLAAEAGEILVGDVNATPNNVDGQLDPAKLPSDPFIPSIEIMEDTEGDPLTGAGSVVPDYTDSPAFNNLAKEKLYGFTTDEETPDSDVGVKTFESDGIPFKNDEVSSVDPEILNENIHSVVKGDTLWGIMKDEHADGALKGLTPDQQNLVLSKLFENVENNKELRASIELRDSENIKWIYPGDQLNIAQLDKELESLVKNVDNIELKTISYTGSADLDIISDATDDGSKIHISDHSDDALSQHSEIPKLENLGDSDPYKIVLGNDGLVVTLELKGVPEGDVYDEVMKLADTTIKENSHLDEQALRTIVYETLSAEYEGRSWWTQEVISGFEFDDSHYSGETPARLDGGSDLYTSKNEPPATPEHKNLMNEGIRTFGSSVDYYQALDSYVASIQDPAYGIFDSFSEYTSPYEFFHKAPMGDVENFMALPKAEVVKYFDDIEIAGSDGIKYEAFDALRAYIKDVKEYVPYTSETTLADFVGKDMLESVQQKNIDLAQGNFNNT